MHHLVLMHLQGCVPMHRVPYQHRSVCRTVVPNCFISQTEFDDGRSPVIGLGRFAISGFGSTPLEYKDWSTKLAGLGKTKVAADLNAFQISIGQATGPEVKLTDVYLDGNLLGDFNGVNATTQNWLVTGSSMNLTDGFILTGNLWLRGPFSGGAESNVVNLNAGWDTRGVAGSGCCS